LSELSIIGTAIGFRLDSVCNGSFVGAPGAEHLYHANYTQSHRLYICSLEPMQFCLPRVFLNPFASLKASNLRWDAIVKQGFATFARPSFQLPTKAVQWQVLVLHPDAVCPEGSPIPVLKNPSLEKVVNPIWVNHSAVRFTLCDSDDQPYIFIHGDPGGESLIPVLPTTRLEDESVSVINVNAKLQHAISNNYPGATDTNILSLADIVS